MTSRSAAPGGWWVWLAAFVPMTSFVAMIGHMLDPELPADSLKRAAVLGGLLAINLLATASVERWFRHRLSRIRDARLVG